MSTKIYPAFKLPKSDLSEYSAIGAWVKSFVRERLEKAAQRYALFPRSGLGASARSKMDQNQREEFLSQFRASLIAYHAVVQSSGSLLTTGSSRKIANQLLDFAPTRLRPLAQRVMIHAEKDLMWLNTKQQLWFYSVPDLDFAVVHAIVSPFGVDLLASKFPDFSFQDQSPDQEGYSEEKAFAWKKILGNREIRENALCYELFTLDEVADFLLDLYEKMEVSQK